MRFLGLTPFREPSLRPASDVKPRKPKAPKPPRLPRPISSWVICTCDDERCKHIPVRA